MGETRNAVIQNRAEQRTTGGNGRACTFLANGHDLVEILFLDERVQLLEQPLDLSFSHDGRSLLVIRQ